MARTEKYEPQEVIDALYEAKGIIAVAASNLGCTRPTVYNYIKKYPEVQEAQEHATEEVVDLAENRLYAVILNKSHKDHYRSVEFMLRTKGRHRGYSEKVEYDLGSLADAAENLGLGQLNLDALSRDQIEKLHELLEIAYEAQNENSEDGSDE